MHLIFSPQHLLIEFADAGLGNGLYEFYVVGEPPPGYQGTEILHDFVFGDVSNIIRLGHHTGQGALGPLGMRNAYNAGL